MRKALLASFALSALAMSVVAPTSQAGPTAPGPEGRKCSYLAVSDPAPDADADAMTGEINAGPLVWDKHFWLHCHLQVNSQPHNGSSNDTVDEHSESTPVAAGNEAAAMDARPVNYDSPENAQDYLCTSVSWPTVTGPNWLYWVAATNGTDQIPGTPDDTPGRWTPDPTKNCPASTQFSTGPLIDALNDVIEDMVDPTLCDALKALHDDPTFGGHTGPGTRLIYVDYEGDVFIADDDLSITEDDWQNDIFWDCSHYVDYPLPGADGLNKPPTTHTTMPLQATYVIDY